jgi:hypothetical protein
MKKYSVIVDRIKSLRKELTTEVDWLRSSLSSDIVDVLTKEGFVKWTNPEYPNVMNSSDLSHEIDFRYIYHNYVHIIVHKMENGKYKDYTIVYWYFGTKDFETFYNKKIKPLLV